MTLTRYLDALRRRWRILLATLLAALGAGVALTALATPIYSASSTSFVGTTSAAAEANQLYSHSQYTLNQVASYTELVHSPDVLEPVARELGDLTRSELDRALTVTNPTGTALLVVDARHPDPEVAQYIANAVAAGLREQIETLETPHGADRSPVKVSPAVPATLPTTPDTPRWPLNLALALLVGLGGGAALALTRDLLDTTIKSPEDLAEMGAGGYLGAVHSERTLRRHPLAALAGPAAVTEDYRTIRTSLRFADVDTATPLYVLTSAIADEGKTITACNLALTMAQHDLDVCLVEADLRRPGVATMLGIDGSLGLTDVLAGDHDLSEVKVPWRRGLISVLPAGSTPPDPARLLGSTAMEDLLARLRQEHDLVIVDAPPLLPVSDARVLCGLADGVVLIARHHRVKREQLGAAVSAVESTGTLLVGAVLNRVPTRHRKRALSGSYGYQDAPVLRPVPTEPTALVSYGTDPAPGPETRTRHAR